MCSARNRSRRASDRANRSVSSTSIVPAEGSATPAIRLSSVVFPEPLRPRRTVQLAAGSAKFSTLSTSKSPPPGVGNDFLTSRSTTANRVLIATTGAAAADRPNCSLQDGDRVNRYADSAFEQQRAKHEHELVRLIVGQLVEVENLHDVGAPVPDEVDVQRQAEKAERLPCIIGPHRETPFHRRIIRADRD